MLSTFPKFAKTTDYRVLRDVRKNEEYLKIYFAIIDEMVSEYLGGLVDDFTAVYFGSKYGELGFAGIRTDESNYATLKDLGWTHFSRDLLEDNSERLSVVDSKFTDFLMAPDLRYISDGKGRKLLNLGPLLSHHSINFEGRGNQFIGQDTNASGYVFELDGVVYSGIRFEFEHSTIGEVWKEYGWEEISEEEFDKAYETYRNSV